MHAIFGYSLLTFTLLAAADARAEVYVALSGGNNGVTQTAPAMLSVGHEVHNAFIDVSSHGDGNLGTGTMGVFVSATPHSPILSGR